MLTSYKKPFLPIIVALGKRIEKRRFSEAPVFVGGCARSGTTLFLSVLSAHKDLFCIKKELELFTKIGYEKDGKPFPKRMDRLYTFLLLNKISRRAKRFCEKSPRNILRVEEIDQYYNGNFKMIQIIRDGRDVILSKHPSAENEYWVSPERWINDVSEGLKYMDHPNVHTIRYEDLIKDYENTIRGVCDFLDIAYTDEIANWHNHANVRKNRAYFTKQVQKISTSSIGKWQKSEENRKRAATLMEYPEAVELLKRFNYL